MDELVAALRANHIRRLRKGECTVYAGLAFLDALVNVERIADQCSNIGVYTISQAHASMKTHHDYISWLHTGGDPLFNSEFQEKKESYFERLVLIETQQ